MTTGNSPTPSNVTHPAADIEKNEYEKGKLYVEITQTIERDLAERAVFPTVRPKHASKVRSIGTSEHWIAMALAKDLLEDAKARRGESSIPRGTARAYSCLISSLEEEIRRKEREGLFEDPGYEEAVSRMDGELYRLPVGSPALLWNGKRVEIYRPFGIYCVLNTAGPFVGKDGRRMEYKPGYIIKEAGGEPTFIPPCDLTTIDGGCAYLRSVPTRSIQAPARS
ncbi:MAG: hypothetical protein EOP50_00780 [Sphingobacteriales bacterium]|nr:MAG: hypothetical protein EOP50_00780 [Sphingobacteriales bacterium]